MLRVLLWLTSLYACVLGVDLDFAVVGGELFSRINSEFEDRGDHALYTLVQVLAEGGVPDVRASMGNLQSDALQLETFSMWRPPNATAPLLWPDHDYSGWAFAWIPPHDVVAHELARHMPTWEHRNRDVFWSGAGLNNLRRKFGDCSTQHPESIYADFIKWDNLRSDVNLPFVKTGERTKPMDADLRKLTQHKFLIYLWGNSWSSSLKRLAAAGAVLLLPERDPFESWASLSLRRCRDCFLLYDAENICESVQAAVGKVSDEAAQAMAQRLNAFTMAELSEASARRFIRDQLNELGARQPLTNITVLPGISVTFADGLILPHITCGGIKVAHKKKLGQGLEWQVDAWLDDNCTARPVPYLGLLPLR